MTKVTGPVDVKLLTNKDKQYLVISDRHTHFNKNGCVKSYLGKDAFLLPEYLDALFDSNKDKQWDFYLEQGTNEVDSPLETVDWSDDKPLQFLSMRERPLNKKIIEKTNEIYKAIKNDTKKEKGKYGIISLISLIGLYFTDCFNSNNSFCRHPHVRFHFIDVRQNKFGKLCHMTMLNKYHTTSSFLIANLFIILDGGQKKQQLTQFLNYYFDSLQNLSLCFQEPKLINQIEKSTMKSEINNYFEGIVSIMLTILNYEISFIKPRMNEIIKDLITKTDGKNDKEIIDIIISTLLEVKEHNYPLGKFSKLVEDLKENHYMNLASSDIFNEHSSQILDIFMFSQQLIMDMYSIARMTKPYNDNIIVVAGYYHTNVFSNFLELNSYKIEWKSKQLTEKCAEIPGSWKGGKRKTRRHRKKKRKSRVKKTKKASCGI